MGLAVLHAAGEAGRPRPALEPAASARRTPTALRPSQMRVSQPEDDVERRAELLADSTVSRPQGGSRRRRSPLSTAPSSVGDALLTPGRPLDGGERVRLAGGRRRDGASSQRWYRRRFCACNRRGRIHGRRRHRRGGRLRRRFRRRPPTGRARARTCRPAAEPSRPSRRPSPGERRTARESLRPHARLRDVPVPPRSESRGRDPRRAPAAAVADAAVGYRGRRGLDGNGSDADRDSGDDHDARSADDRQLGGGAGTRQARRRSARRRTARISSAPRRSIPPARGRCPSAAQVRRPSRGLRSPPRRPTTSSCRRAPPECGIPTARHPGPRAPRTCRRRSRRRSRLG